MEQIRNAVYDTCDECGETFAYEKDEDSPVACIEVEPYRYENLCEKCAGGDSFHDDNDKVGELHLS